MSNVELKLKDTINDNDIYDIYIDNVYAGGLEANYDPRINSFYIENIKKSDSYKSGHLLKDVVNYLYNDKGYDLGCLPLEKYRGYYEELGFTPFIYNDNDVYYHKIHKGDNMKTDEFLNEVKNIINEDNMSELKKELSYLYKGIGWAEWNYFKEGLAYSTNFKPEEITDEDLEKMINSSGIAKVKQVKDIKNYSDMEDFNPEDFNPDDKIILTKKPMSNQFYSESSQKSEALNGLNDYKRFYEDMKEFREDMAKVFPGDKRELLDQIDHLLYVIRAMWDGEIIDESSQRNGSLDLSKLSSKDAAKLAKYFDDFAKDKTIRYDLIDKIEDILDKKYKDESSQKNEGLNNGQILLEDLINLAKSKNLPMNSAILIPSKTGGRTLAGRAKTVHFTGDNYGIELLENE